MDSRNTSASPKKGDAFGQWLLTKLLGEGGNSFVYLAKSSNGIEVAIKILAKTEGRGNKVYERFKQEIAVTKQNSDIKGLLPIIDAYLPDEITSVFPWYAMPVCQSLESYIKDLSIPEIVKLVVDIGKSLEQLHNRGISHRDIKPANILVKDGQLYLIDFGLLHIDNGLDLTSAGEIIGARWTIAPEMRRQSVVSDGKPADVYSLAKTLWILITGKKDGFDGQYNPESINGLKKHNLLLTKTNVFDYQEPVPLYVKPLDDLLVECTNDDPSQRPTMIKFVDALVSWLDLYNNLKKRNPLEWRDMQLNLFSFAVPQRAIWETIGDVVEIINLIGCINSLNHILLPSGGGMDLLGAKIGLEEKTIEVIIEKRWVYVVKPKKLIFESFGTDWEWNYFRLETEYLNPIFGQQFYPRHLGEELVEIEPLKYLHRRYWDEGEYNGKSLPENSRLVTRWIKGDFLIVQKTSIYNSSPSTYDGRHNQLSTDQFRNYMENRIMIARQAKNNSKFLQYAQDTGISIDEVILSLMKHIFHQDYMNFFRKENLENKDIENL